MKNKKMYILIVVLVVVLAGAVWLNFALADKGADAADSLANADAQVAEGGTETVAVAADTLALNDYKAEREAAREQEMAYLDTIIADEKTDAETLADAQQRKLDTVYSMESELTIEGLLGAKGFENAIVTVHTGSVNVVVGAEELTTDQVAQIVDIVQTETGEAASNIKIILQD